MNRREFLRKAMILGGSLTGYSLLPKVSFGQKSLEEKNRLNSTASQVKISETKSHIYLCRNGTPEQNTAAVIEMMGGIEETIDKEDIVIIKPNAQWTGHATTNTNAIMGFIDLVLGIPGFKGEIIIAENHHYEPENSRGWTTKNRNGDFNLNELIQRFNNKGHPNVTKYHWKDGGPNPHPVHGNAGSGGIVSGPDEGDGYVWCEEEYVFEGSKTKMTYPIFTSTFSGVKIDLRYGAWRDGVYTSQPIKLINFPALNHHGNSGITAAIKNYMGIVDLSCGFHGSEPQDYYNFHYVGFPWPKTKILSKLLQQLLINRALKKEKHIRKLTAFAGPTTGALGGAIGHFMKTIRKADLNIISAEYVGHESRWRNPIHMKTILASKDPVALDYYAAKHIVLPLGGSKAGYHDPDNPQKTLRKILEACKRQGIGNISERNTAVHACSLSQS